MDVLFGNWRKNIVCVRKPYGNSSVRYRKPCGAAVIILLKERYMSMSFISEEKRKESLDEARKAKEACDSRVGDCPRRRGTCVCPSDRWCFGKFFSSVLRQIHIKGRKVITDEWSGYLPLKKDYPKLEQRPSDKGKGHPQIHIHIMNIKGWLRGIHHHCSKEHLQGYLDEYHFRFNRRNNMDTIFDMLLRRMICQKKTDW